MSYLFNKNVKVLRFVLCPFTCSKIRDSVWLDLPWCIKGSWLIVLSWVSRIVIVDLMLSAKHTVRSPPLQVRLQTVSRAKISWQTAHKRCCFMGIVVFEGKTWNCWLGGAFLKCCSNAAPPNERKIQYLPFQSLEGTNHKVTIFLSFTIFPCNFSHGKVCRTQKMKIYII